MCRTEYKTEYKTEYDDKCETKYETKCEIQYETVYEEVCDEPVADEYGAPSAPVLDTYGSPQADPIQQDSYGSPKAPVQVQILYKCLWKTDGMILLFNRMSMDHLVLLLFPADKFKNNRKRRNVDR